MELKEKIAFAKKQGISIKLLSQLSNINVNTIYAFTSGNRELSLEKKEKLSNILDTLIIKLEN